jgi:hypothetical protein
VWSATPLAKLVDMVDHCGLSDNQTATSSATTTVQATTTLDVF